MSASMEIDNTDMSLVNSLMDQVFNIAYNNEKDVSDFAMIIGTYESMLKTYVDPADLVSVIDDLKTLKRFLAQESE